ncbi:MAG: glycosyltransferase [Oscillatoria princeps RMCB-10]|nr:glycosyltransferase [Oscillatoria princeps RMCB-10]
MNILYCGIFDGAAWRAEYAMLEGFQRIGHSVSCCNYMDSRALFEALHACQTSSKKPDIVFIQYGPGFPAEALSSIAIPVAFMASEFSIDSARHLLDAPRKPDLVLAHSQQVCEYALSKGINAVRVHHAYNPRFYNKLDVPYKYEISFVGNFSERRMLVLLETMLKGYDIHVVTSTNAEEVNRIYNESKITLHIHASEETYIPTRFFEVMPTKACLLCEQLGNNNDPSLGSDYFEMFSDLSELCEKIDFLLANEDKRTGMVTKSMALASRHTWAARMEEYTQHFQALLG